MKITLFNQLSTKMLSSQVSKPAWISICVIQIEGHHVGPLKKIPSEISFLLILLASRKMKRFNVFTCSISLRFSCCISLYAVVLVVGGHFVKIEDEEEMRDRKNPSILLLDTLDAECLISRFSPRHDIIVESFRMNHLSLHFSMHFPFVFSFQP